MVFVKVRETFDLNTISSKMSIIGVHTPSATIIKQNYPGLLMQCKAYRPVSCDIRLACASVLPADPLQVGLTTGDVAPEDLFNPILYKACSNFGMSQLDAWIEGNTTFTDYGSSVTADIDGIFPDTQTTYSDFDLYYGLLSQTHEWKHANPQSGLEMSNLVPIVYETYQTIGQNSATGTGEQIWNQNPDTSSTVITGVDVQTFRGSSHPIPMLNCTTIPSSVSGVRPGFSDAPGNIQTDIPAPKVFTAVLVIPPSRLHQLFYRMVVEWTLEFSKIRPLGDITSWVGLAQVGQNTHFQSYDYSESKTLSTVTSTVDTNDDTSIKKVM